jgi:SAM-dependent methyltransferase
VVGVDASQTLVRAATDAGPGPFLVADAAALPFADSSFDLAVAYNVVMDLDDLAVSLQEVARSLTPGGRLAACVLHPIAEAGEFESPRGRAFLHRDRLLRREPQPAHASPSALGQWHAARVRVQSAHGVTRDALTPVGSPPPSTAG